MQPAFLTGEYKYLDWPVEQGGHGMEFPQLVLGMEARYAETRVAAGDFALPRERGWRFIAHQSAGIACHQVYVVGLCLPLRPERLEGVRALCGKWFESNVGFTGRPGLSELVEYQADLAELVGGVASCESSYTMFEEAVYPLDVSPAILEYLSGEVLPENLDELLDWSGSSLARAFGAWHRWDLMILGENSD